MGRAVVYVSLKRQSFQQPRYDVEIVLLNELPASKGVHQSEPLPMEQGQVERGLPSVNKHSLCFLLCARLQGEKYDQRYSPGLQYLLY